MYIYINILYIYTYWYMSYSILILTSPPYIHTQFLIDATDVSNPVAVVGLIDSCMNQASLRMTFSWCHLQQGVESTLFQSDAGPCRSVEGGTGESSLRNRKPGGTTNVHPPLLSGSLLTFDGCPLLERWMRMRSGKKSKVLPAVN